ncbi:MAG: MFS transporter [Acidimicrobiales bacterium]
MTERAPLSIWRNRDFRLLFAGATINDTGDWLLELALPLYVFVETESGIATAAVYVVRLLVGLACGPFGGSLADRWRLRATLVGTNVLQAVALAPLLFVTGDRIWPVFIVVVVQGVITSVNDPAGFALMPRLVDDDQLVSANSAMSAGGSIARLIGAAAGGIAVGAGGMTAVVIADAATFVAGAVAALLMSDAANLASLSDETNENDSSVRAGLRTLRDHPVVSALVGVQGLAMFGFGAFPVLFIVFVTDYLNGSEADVGVIRASSAFGGLVAAALIGGVAARYPPAKMMAAGYGIFAVVGFIFVNAPSITTALWVYLVLFALTGFPNIASQVGARSTGQLLCPPEVLGRLGGLMSAAMALGMGLGSVTAGLLLEVLTARTLFNGQVAVLALCAGISFVLIVRPLQAAEVEPG